MGHAIKFTEKDEVVLRLEAGSLVADALPLGISVRASGIGVPAEQRWMIFRHFYRGGLVHHSEAWRNGFGLRFAAVSARDGLPAVSPP